MTLGYSTEHNTDFGRFTTMQEELRLLRKALVRQYEYIKLMHEARERNVSRTERRRAFIKMSNALNDYTGFCETEGLDYYVE